MTTSFELLEKTANRIFSSFQDMISALSLQSSTVSDLENLTGVEFVAHPPVDEFAGQFSLPRVDEWFSSLGEDLTIRISLSDDPKIYNITKSDVSGLVAVSDILDRIEIEHISVRVEIKKAALRALVSEACGFEVDALFYYSTSLIARLSAKGIDTLFLEGVIGPGKHSVVAILEGCGIVQSPYLTIIGLSDSSLSRADLLPLPSIRQHKWEDALGLRRATAMWAAPLSNIPPDMFEAKVAKPGLEGVYHVMLGMCGALSTLQFCASVTETSGFIIANIGQPGSVVIKMKTDAVYRDSPSSLGSSAFRLYRWAFRTESYDKVDVVRDLLTHETRNFEVNAMEHLIATAQQILDAARSSYRILRKQAFEAYLRSRESARSEVASYVASTRKSIDKLRSDMLARVLQFFAAIIAYLAASVLKTDLSKSVRISGIGLGMVYLALIVVYQLYPSWQQYKKSGGEVLHSVDSHTELTPFERQKIVEQVPTGQHTEFANWYWACITIYGVGMAALLGALIYCLA